MEDRDLEFSVVSGSNEEMLFGCLQSLHKTLEKSQYSWSVTVTCNEDGTGMAGRVRARYPDAMVIQNEKPLGFAANHNRVLRSSYARYVWMLNDDLMILPAAIQRVTELMDSPGNARIAIVSPELLNPDGSVQPSTYSFPSMAQTLLLHSGLTELPLTEKLLASTVPFPRDQDQSSLLGAVERVVDVDTLRGVCVAVRTKAVRQIGPIAEAATLAGEESEWHRRFKEHGWRVVYFPEANVIHYGSQAVRNGPRSLYPENLKPTLYFFKTGRSSPIYAAFCATLLGLFGVRAAFSWASRDKAGVDVARRYAEVAWVGLRRK